MDSLVSPRVLFGIDALLFIAWAIAFAMVLLAAVPEHAIGATGVTKRRLALFLPESWAFFTRNPRERLVSFFEVKKDGSLEPGNATDVRGNRFWPTRADRLRELEVGLVQGQVPKAAWVSCRGSLDECARPWRDKSPVAVTVDLHRPSYCGEAVITESEPVPWAWRRSYSKVHLPMRIVRVNIECRQRTRPT